MRSLRSGLLLLFGLVALPQAGFFAHDEHEHGGGADHGNAANLRNLILKDQPLPQIQVALGATPCVNGFAGTFPSFPCSGIDLMAFLPFGSMGGGLNVADIWGWTDPLTGHEYAIVGRSNGTAFVDVTEPTNPIYVGNLPSHIAGNNLWREMKVYGNYALIVSEFDGHGMQVFNLAQLRDVTSPPQIFVETAHYAGFGNCHNIVLNEETGYAYAVGTNTCSGGLHMVNVQNPLAPSFAGCFSQDGYVHDAQCVVYHGPDADYQGREMCFGSDTDTLTIVDVTNKSAPLMVSRTSYVGVGYTHQGWLTEDHAYFLLDDELDEQQQHHNSRTRIWDMSNLDAPVVSGIYDGPTTAIDHNLYVRGGFAYEANYRAGLRILDLARVAAGILTEVAFFDVYPQNDNPNFNGAWGNYPFFSSGTIVVSSIEQGLFVLRPTFCTLAEVEGLTQSDEVSISWSPTGQHGTRYDVLRGAIAELPVGPGGFDEVCLENDLTTTSTVDTDTPDPGEGVWYAIRAETSCGAGSYGSGSTSLTCP